MEFKSLELSGPIEQAIEDLGFEKPSDIQTKAIPILLQERADFVGLAQTGSGKTAAFVIPLLQKIKANKVIQAIILTPSRELAKQVENEIKLIGKYLDITSTPIYGGVSYDKQLYAIKKNKPEIIVGTPGRVIDLIQQNVLNLSKVNTCILDEADEMLRMGFFEDVNKVISFLNNKKNIWMFSATMPDEISKLISSEFRSPQIVKAKRQNNIGPDISQQYFISDRKRRHEAIYRILQVEENHHSIIFCRTRQETRELSDKLADKGLRVETLSGEMSQHLRESAMNKFKSHKTNIMICTDVAARGIDVKDITHVFNYGLPQDNETYVHRIGRTARAGKSGTAITIITPEDRRYLEKLAATVGYEIKEAKIPPASALKEKLTRSSIERMNKIAEAVLEKGDEYQIDPTFKIFNKNFKDFSKDELAKVLFTYIFNKDFRHVDELGDLTPRRRKQQPSSSRNDRQRRRASTRTPQRDRKSSNTRVRKRRNNKAFR